MQLGVSKTIGVITVLTALTGCTTTPRLPPASEAEQNASGAAYVACLDKNAARLDDRVSEAATIARALMEGPCADELAASKETYTRDMTPAERRIFDSHVTADFQVALDIVARHRAIGHRTTGPKRSPAKTLPVTSQSMQ